MCEHLSLTIETMTITVASYRDDDDDDDAVVDDDKAPISPPALTTWLTPSFRANSLRKTVSSRDMSVGCSLVRSSAAAEPFVLTSPSPCAPPGADSGP